jgi:plasmid stabilization system protein ParE
MSREFVVTPAAEFDLTNAYRWYEAKRPGLGIDFISCVEDEFERVRRRPESWPLTYKNVRQTLVRRFPYVVCFTCDESAVRIVAVFHGHRDPEVWQSRVT